ncbi:hypothetical protein A8H39_10850 [Paraburkholderia fungorum]|nr:hypothetical protein A8H39_10850 [Paraburkholderia fungorum]
MKLADTPARIYRMPPVPTKTERAERYATAWETAPKLAPNPFVWCFPRVLGTRGKPVSPVWRAQKTT